MITIELHWKGNPPDYSPKETKVLTMPLKGDLFEMPDGPKYAVDHVTLFRDQSGSTVPRVYLIDIDPDCES